MVTVSPLLSRRAPMAADARPLPSDESTPPVMKMNFVLDVIQNPHINQAVIVQNVF
jgi:hypothetical protein